MLFQECLLVTVVLSQVVSLNTLVLFILFASSSIKFVALHVLHYKELIIEIEFIFAIWNVLPIIVFNYDYIVVVVIFVDGSLLG